MSRKNARELVIKFLFQMEARDEDYGELMGQFMEDNRLKQDEEIFFTRSVEGIMEHLEEIDSLIQNYLVNWTKNRLPGVDLAVLRNALFEILYLEDIPVSVSINEAVEIAKKYSNADSGAFVNGILGKVVRERDLH